MMSQNNGNLPTGFGLALAQNPEAMAAFTALPYVKRQAMVQRAQHAATKEEMQSVVDELKA